ncbi:alpha/beta fold hydrolase [Actinosynnema sp. NPDC047251]|uniref:Putative hydrolase n=1 Tax=Saccharothrix espanaensis (strain ATCC 51144 / DSM 44229 / JCM 9112 / NBRC 15066 / NRRL 15764) TaxID=1179773 RepID=K0K0Z6_SACES|nr:alpha/beta fold hydrolase [Saccharothrix espanaensis]CCH30529.1 putative hydrolase [Saccharothrix espanaensis DSM 44229]
MDGKAQALFLHGLAGKAAVWDPIAAALPDRFATTRPDLPWHGMADPAWAHLPDPGRYLVDAVWDGHDVVVAHSMAAMLLVECYAQGRVRPRPTVLLCPFYRPDPADFDWPTISYYLNDFHRTFTEALRVGETARFPESRREWLARSLRDQVGPYGWTRWFETYLRTPLLDLGAIGAPVLVVSGVDDVAARPEDGRALAKALPRARFELLDGCGHFPMIEQPDRLAALVRDFFEESLELT